MVVGLPAAEYSGHAPAWDRVVFRGDPASREFIAFWLRGDRVLASMNVNMWDVTDPIRRLVRSAFRSTTAQPRVSKHLRVLREVEAVDVREEGRQRLYRLNGHALKPIHDWVKPYERSW